MCSCTCWYGTKKQYPEAAYGTKKMDAVCNNSQNKYPAVILYEIAFFISTMDNAKDILKISYILFRKSWWKAFTTKSPILTVKLIWNTYTYRTHPYMRLFSYVYMPSHVCVIASSMSEAINLALFIKFNNIWLI